MQETQEKTGASVLTGRMAWFNGAKGFGFVIRDDGKGDIFCHWSNIKGMVGYKDLKGGQRISFGLGVAPDGRPQAVDIFVIEEDEAS